MCHAISTTQVDELEQRGERQSKFSRRRTEVPGADVDFINDRNKHFNKKIKRAFDKVRKERARSIDRNSKRSKKQTRRTNRLVRRDDQCACCGS